MQPGHVILKFLLRRSPGFFGQRDLIFQSLKGRGIIMRGGYLLLQRQGSVPCCGRKEGLPQVEAGRAIVKAHLRAAESARVIPSPPVA